MIDTSIWIDVYEDRKGFNGEPLGEYGLKLLSDILARKDKIIISEILIDELSGRYSLSHILGMLKPFEDIIEKIIPTEEEKKIAKKISIERELPLGDALHAIIARDNNAILITRDKHFRKLEDISSHYRPEEII